MLPAFKMVVSNVLSVANPLAPSPHPLLAAAEHAIRHASLPRPRPSVRPSALARSCSRARARFVHRRSLVRRGSIPAANHLTMAAALLVTFFVGVCNNWAKPPARPDYCRGHSSIPRFLVQRAILLMARNSSSKVEVCGARYL